MMKKLPHALALAATGVLLCACGGGDSAPDAGAASTAGAASRTAQAQAALPASDPAVPGEVVLKLHRKADLPALLARHALTQIGQFGQRPIYRLGTAVGASADLEALAERLRADARVQYAEPNYVQETPESRRRRVWFLGGDAGTYATQWNTSALRLADAHARSTGTGVTVAVLDTGIDDQHPALAGRLTPGFDFVDFDDQPREEGAVGDFGFGHGTHVASLVAQVAPGARIMPIRVLDAQGAGNIWVLAEGLLHAVDPDGNPVTDDGAKVINLSLGTTRKTDLLRNIVGLAVCDDDAEDDDSDDASDDGDALRCKTSGGAVVVGAAGNSGDQTPHYPAAETQPGAVSVAASTEAGRLADFSTRGDWVQVAAPGEHIYGAVPGGGYGVWSGSSMAAPMAAGVAALLRSAERGFKPSDVVGKLVSNGVQLCDSGLKQVDAAAALSLGSRPGSMCR